MMCVCFGENETLLDIAETTMTGDIEITATMQIEGATVTE